jgi:hypothetical protein
MRSRLSLFAWTLASVAVFDGTAAAVVVPDDYPTIQAAINSGAPVVEVKQGTYPENLTITGNVQLTSYQESFHYLSFPRVEGSLSVTSQPGTYATIRGLWFTGPVSLNGGTSPLQIFDCRFDAGVTGGPSIAFINMRGCIVRGTIDLSAELVEITNNTVLAGGIRARHSAGACAIARSNVVIGPSAFGIDVTGIDACADVFDNLVSNCTDGIVVPHGDGTEVRGNRIEDCANDGIRASGASPISQLTVAQNTILRCGGDGIQLTGVYPTIRDNLIADVGGFGIQSVGSTLTGHFTGNRVLRAGADGMNLDAAQTVTGNVVGRSGQRGLVLADVSEGGADHNTSYWNASAGYAIGGPASSSVHHNIAYNNQGAGLAWSGGGSPALSCNDWFGNLGGATTGTVPGATDLALDPLFCNVPADNVSLSTFSPVLNAPGCGLIGALGVGCSEPVSVVRPSRGGVGLVAAPNPAAGDVRFSWPRSEAPATLELFDATGARRWMKSLPQGRELYDWDGLDRDGARLPAGLYYARLTMGTRVLETKIVVLD